MYSLISFPSKLIHCICQIFRIIIKIAYSEIASFSFFPTNSSTASTRFFSDSNASRSCNSVSLSNEAIVWCPPPSSSPTAPSTSLLSEWLPSPTHVIKIEYGTNHTHYLRFFSLIKGHDIQLTWQRWLLLSSKPTQYWFRICNFIHEILTKSCVAQYGVSFAVIDLKEEVGN